MGRRGVCKCIFRGILGEGRGYEKVEVLCGASRYFVRGLWGRWNIWVGTAQYHGTRCPWNMTL
jgi:hypothetical protein